MKYRLPPERYGAQVRAIIDLVAPLAHKATDTHVTDTAGTLFRAWSGAASSPIDIMLRWSGVDSANHRSTPATATMPGCRTSATATRTTTTSRTTTGCVRSAHQSHAEPADVSFEDLVAAYFDCRETKRNKASALEFEENLESNLADLYDELVTGAYRPGPSICFVITRPKPREVWAAQFRDRIVHHLLYNRICGRFYADFIADSCACIPGRGTLYAAKRLEHKVRSITRNWSRPAWYLKCDLANFFVSIDKRPLWALLAAKVTEPFWLRLTETVLFHDPRPGVILHSRPQRMALIPRHKSLFNQPAHRGLPIGNLSSQFFANVYLNELDQFVKHKLRARYYIRYVDDFVLLHESSQWLNRAREAITQYLPNALRIELNPAKSVMQPIARGIDFVGHVIKPWRRTIRRRTFNDALHRLSRVSTDRVFASANSYFGMLRQATHSGRDRGRLAGVVLDRGLSVNGNLTKAYRCHA